MTACSITPVSNTPETKPNYMQTPDTVTVPEDCLDVVDYLKTKYGGEFECIGFSKDRSSFHFESSKFDGVITVRTVSSLIRSGYPEDDFAGTYADNGYAIQIQDSLQEYYEQYLNGWDKHRLMVWLHCEALPSAVNNSVSYTTNRDLYPEYFAPELYIFCENEIPSQQVQALKVLLEAVGESVSVTIIRMRENNWENITIDDILWNSPKLNIRQYFETNVD